MGSIISKGMAENFQKQQDFQIKQQAAMMERQIHMQNMMRERMMATQLARAREMFTWLSSGYATLFVACVAGFRKTKNPGILAPLLPLGFVVAYQADLSYGGKMYRIKDEADRILESEGSILELAGGVPTIPLIDSRIHGKK